jgi:hypothetical protein
MAEDRERYNLKRVEGPGGSEEWSGQPGTPPTEGAPFHFYHDFDAQGYPKKQIVTSPVQKITQKKERTIIRTENSVYALEKKKE